VLPFGRKRKGGRATALAWVAALAALAGCGGQSRCTSSDPAYDLALMTFCYTSDSCDECASPGTCAVAICLGTSDLMSCANPTDPHGSICTLPCGSTADCAQLPTTQDWTTSVGLNGGPVGWACVSGHCFGYYGYTVPDPCAGCGGAFCSGRCSGCPGC